MKTNQKKSNVRGTIYVFLLYLFVGFIATFWLFVAGAIVPESGSGDRLVSMMTGVGLLSWWGGLFLILGGGLAYYSGHVCAKYSADDGTQKPFILAFLLLMPAIALGAIFTGSDKIFEVTIIGIVTLMACTSGHDNHIDA